MAGGKRTDGLAKVVVLDNDEWARACLKGFLQSQKEFAYVRGFGSAAQALAEIPRLRPDLAFLNIAPPDMDSVECAKLLKRLMPDLTILIAHEDRDAEMRRINDPRGIVYLAKPFSLDLLLSALHCALKGPPIRSDSKLPIHTDAFFLSKREQEILNKFAEGLFYKEIPDALGITYSMLRRSQRRIFEKLHVRSRSEAVGVWAQLRCSYW